MVSNNYCSSPHADKKQAARNYYRRRKPQLIIPTNISIAVLPGAYNNTQMNVAFLPDYALFDIGKDYISANTKAACTNPLGTVVSESTVMQASLWGKHHDLSVTVNYAPRTIPILLRKSINIPVGSGY